jgi:hypothetical protein
MASEYEQIFEVSSMGRMYRKSLLMFSHHLEDESGRTVDVEQLVPGRKFFVFFYSGTGLTRTSAERIA